MTITVGKYEFEGPFTDTNSLRDASGIYIILDLRKDTYNLIDCGESAKVKSRIESHDRASCWQKNCLGTLMVAVLYTPHSQSAGRMEIEQDIREKFEFPCGVR